MQLSDEISGLEDPPEQLVMDRVVPPNDDILSTITRLSAKLIQLEAQAEQETAALEKTNRDIEEISKRRLPDLLASVGLTELVVNGRKVSTKTDYFASIPKAKAEEAFAWLRAHNMGSIIKESLSVPVSQKELLAERGIPFTVDASVHSSTLKALVKEQIEAENEFPRELFGVYVADKVVVK